MHKLNRTLFAALFISLAGVTTAGAQTAAEVNKTLDDLFGQHAPYQEFFENLKKAVAENDKQTVASMVDYPFKSRINGKAATIRDAAHFAADYDKVFTGSRCQTDLSYAVCQLAGRDDRRWGSLVQWYLQRQFLQTVDSRDYRRQRLGIGGFSIVK